MPAASAGRLLAALLLLAACSGPETGPRERPPVLLIVMDTVRADHLGVYGYPRPTSPSVDALAAGADRYTRCLSTAPWTLPSHASLFTGLYPFEHGTHAARGPDGRIRNGRPLAPALTTLAEALAAEGYRTAAFAANTVYLARRFRLMRGFRTYDLERIPGTELNRRIFRWLARIGDQPFFLFVNYMDAHRPYNVAPLPGERAGSLPAPSGRSSVELLDRLYQVLFAQRRPAPAGLVRELTIQYDRGVANADRAVGELLDRLRVLGLHDRTLILLTSDHGEYLGEHGLVEHSKDVYQEALHVPLLVKRPGQHEGRVLREGISLVRVPQLVLATLPGGVGARHPELLSHGGPGGELLAELYFSRTKDLRQPWGARFQRVRRALVSGDRKLILSSDGKNELYDLAADPGEQRSLVAEQPALAARLEARLHRLLGSGRPVAPAPELPPPTPALLRELEALGYLEGSPRPAPPGGPAAR